VHGLRAAWKEVSGCEFEVVVVVGYPLLITTPAEAIAMRARTLTVFMVDMTGAMVLLVVSLKS